MVDLSLHEQALRMIHFRIFQIIFLGATLLLTSCEENGKNSEETTVGDSIEVSDEESTRGVPLAAALRPGLFGTWEMVDMRLGNEPLPQTIPGNSYLEFLETGKVVVFSDGFTPDTGQVSQNGDLLYSSVWGAPQRIDSLNQSRLILVEMLDGAEVSYIYQRK